MDEFPIAAAGALAPVADQVHRVREATELGGLRMDQAEARVLLANLAKIRARVDDLVTGCGALDQPLRFGDNWVGAIMADRLHGVAATDRQSVTSVMTEFRQVLDDLEATVRAAAGVYAATDQRGADDIRQAARRLGLAHVTVEGGE